VRFLGFIVDTLFGKFRLTSTQKQKLRSAEDLCLKSPSQVPAKTLARVTTGLAQSLSLLTGPVAGLFCRFLHRALARRSSWYISVALDAPALGELRFWRDHLVSFQSRDIWRVFSVLRVLYYDAGGNGWGGHLHISPEEHEAHGPCPRSLSVTVWLRLPGGNCLRCNGQHTDTGDATALSAKLPHSLYVSSDSYILVSCCEPYN
jgi:hypothetical protein